jgi:hypothetical protein
MYRETTLNNEIHVSHNISTRFRLNRTDRVWEHLDDLGLSSKIEMRYNDRKGVQ